VSDASWGRAARVAGLGAVAFNVLGVAALSNVPGAYRPGDLGGWYRGLLERPLEAQASAWCFVLGLLLLAVFFVVVAAGAPCRSRGLLVAGAALCSLGAAVNAAGSAAPLAVVLFLPEPAFPGAEAVARGMLGFALATDAAFNLVLGLGLVTVNVALGPDSGWPRWQRALGVAAGLASVPVAGQVGSDGWARLLAISGPLWLAWIAASCLAGPWRKSAAADDGGRR